MRNNCDSDHDNFDKKSNQGSTTERSGGEATAEEPHLLHIVINTVVIMMMIINLMVVMMMIILTVIKKAKYKSLSPAKDTHFPRLLCLQQSSEFGLLVHTFDRRF